MMMNQPNYIKDENFNNLFFQQYPNNQNSMINKSGIGNNQNFDNNDDNDPNYNRGRNKRLRNGMNQ